MAFKIGAPCGRQGAIIIWCHAACPALPRTEGPGRCPAQLEGEHEFLEACQAAGGASVPCRLQSLGPRLPGLSPHPFRPGSRLAFSEARSDLPVWICPLPPAAPSSVT